MKAVILAAGKGVRMRELTNELPKPMLLVQGKPILEHIICGILAAGVRDIFIVTGYRSESIEAHFGDGAKWNAHIAYGRQIAQDGTGKAAEVAKEFVGDSPFILAYADILVKPETYEQLVQRFGGGNFSGVITVTRGEDVTKGGLNFFDEEFCLRRLMEKPSRSQVEQLRQEGWLKRGDSVWYNAGIYVFRPSLFEFTTKLNKSPRGEYELTDAITGMINAGHRLAGMEIAGRWVDVRDPEVLAALESGSAEISVRRAPSPTGQRVEFYSCFLSHSVKDRAFVEHLYTDLLSKGVSCFYAPEDIKIGESIRPKLHEAISLYDKLLVVLSKNSVCSEWVEKEVERAMEREREQGRKVLFPIRIDDAVMTIKVGWPADMRTRQIGDFTNIGPTGAYEKALERLLRDLAK